jgi:hypothetical protein
MNKMNNLQQDIIENSLTVFEPESNDSVHQKLKSGNDYPYSFLDDDYFKNENESMPYI